MENLLLEFQQKIARTSLDFQRYLIDEIDWNNQLIAIKGARGSGKPHCYYNISKTFESKDDTIC